MPREQFYEVPRGAWLFTPSNPESTTREQPEESVRQWCAQELIRAYGYRVTDLSFEHTVKVGSKTYRVDIIIRKDDRIFAIVECKERGFKRHEKALEQAISYASSRDVACELVLYTNGDTWLARRKVGRIWAPVADFPNRDRASAQGSMDALLMTVQNVAPILHCLDESISGKEAKAFLAALQEFFNGGNLLTEAFNRELLHATDNLLRVLSVGMDDKPYSDGKMSAAAHYFESYRKLSGAGYALSDSYRGVGLHTCFAELRSGLFAIIDGQRDSANPDILLLCLNVALLKYGREILLRKGVYVALTPEIHATLRHVLEFGFAVGLGVQLPTALECTTVSDMKLFCSNAWHDFLSENIRD